MKSLKAIKFATKHTITFFLSIYISYVVGKRVDKFLGKYNLPKPIHNILFIIFGIIYTILIAYILKPI
ncbi:hypothetical protein DP68_15665 [Clostridium sp. HMP27]|nr:hypothetical protein DP68_15665 [Clostridium sp. HMP27]